MTDDQPTQSSEPGEAAGGAHEQPTEVTAEQGQAAQEPSAGPPPVPGPEHPAGAVPPPPQQPGAQPGQQPPPGYYYQPPPGAYYYQPGAQQAPGHGPYQPVYYPPQAHQPGNSNAIASIILSCGSLGLLLITAGVAAPLTLIASAIAIPLGHKGKQDVDQGKTAQNRDMAVAGFWTGIGGVALSLLALIFWIVVIVLVATSDWHWSNGHLYTHGHDFNFNNQ